MSLFSTFEWCPLCNSIRIDPLKGYEENYLYKCLVCKFVFSRRKPTSEELKEHYALYPRANSISHITLNRYEELLDVFEKFRKTNNLIDVGCGDGFFLEVAEKRKWNVFGTEFTQNAIEICRGKGIQMNSSPIDPNQYETGTFDIVTSFEVMEHINNCNDELSAFHKLLRKGGIVYITTPNWNSISRDILKSKWSVIEYPEHPCYYTKNTLKSLFLRNNFKLLEITTTGISINRIRSSSSNILRTPASNNLDEVLRQTIENRLIFRWLKLAINAILNLTGKGDSIKGMFQKL